MPDLHVSKPAPDEYASYFGRYIDLVPDGDIVATLAAQMPASLEALRAISETDSLKRYAPGKWSIRELAGHISDTERIFAYRALRFSRNDQTPLPGFDQDPYIAAAQFDQRPWRDILEELEAVRRSTVLMFRGMNEEAWKRQGISND